MLDTMPWYAESCYNGTWLCYTLSKIYAALFGFRYVTVRSGFGHHFQDCNELTLKDMGKVKQYQTSIKHDQTWITFIFRHMYFSPRTNTHICMMTKLPPFLIWFSCIKSYSTFTQSCSHRSNQQLDICPDNGLVPNRWQVIVSMMVWNTDAHRSVDRSASMG